MCALCSSFWRRWKNCLTLIRRCCLPSTEVRSASYVCVSRVMRCVVICPQLVTVVCRSANDSPYVSLSHSVRTPGRRVRSRHRYSLLAFSFSSAEVLTPASVPHMITHSLRSTPYHLGVCSVVPNHETHAGIVPPCTDDTAIHCS